MGIANYRELVLGGDTRFGVVNPLGFREDYGGMDMSPIEELVELRKLCPDQVMVAGGGLTPNQGVARTLDRMQMMVEKYKVTGFKFYTFDATKKGGWYLDDEKLAYPMWERLRKLGIKTVAAHKGVPFGHFQARYAHPEDFDRVCDDYPDINCGGTHSGSSTSSTASRSPRRSRAATATRRSPTP